MSLTRCEKCKRLVGEVGEDKTLYYADHMHVCKECYDKPEKLDQEIGKRESIKGIFVLFLFGLVLLALFLL